VFKSGVQVREETGRLAAAHGFEPRHVYESALQGFSATLTPEVVASIRCEPSVKYVEHAGVVSING
jgi:hypothetical protein